MQLYPYASVYVGAEGMLGGEARDRVAGFWRALELLPPAEPDHLATLLALYANLRDEADAEPAARARGLALALARASRALLWEHILPWVPVYARKMQAIAGGCYAAWAAMLERALAAEAERAGALPEAPLHLRSAPPLADPRDAGAEPFIAGLLAPVCSGMVIVRDDLRRAARSLGLGLRHGERRFVLTALFAQDREATLGWLAREAYASMERHRATPGLPPAIRDFWIARAQATAALAASLRETTSRRTR